MTTSQREAVSAVADGVRRRIGEPSYRLWFEQHTSFDLDDGTVVVRVANLFLQEWLQTKFAGAVRDSALEILGEPVSVRFAIDPVLFQAARQEQEAITDHGTKSAKKPLTPVPSPSGRGETSQPFSPGESGRGEGILDTVSAVAVSRRARRWRRLPDFVVGPCNRVAHASALSVIESPGLAANPLVLYGPVGTGKSHLLEGIYAELRRRQPASTVVYITAEEFTNRFVQGMRLGKIGGFRRHFRGCDVLLVDDLHFLASKPATQEEFLHTFDTLHADGRQLIATCDCHPRLSDELQPELVDRLVGGAVWGLAPPDPDTRLALLRSKAVNAVPPVSDDVLRLLAEQLHGNVRELEGALHSIRHFAAVAGRPADLALAREALGELLRHSVRAVRIDDVDRAVCAALRLPGGSLQRKERAWAVSHPRMLAMFLSRRHTAASYNEIGRHFGGRNHSTAVAAEKKVRQWLQRDELVIIGDRRLRIRDVIDLVERELQR